LEARKIKTLDKEVIVIEVEKGNPTIDKVFWYFLLVYMAGGYSVLKYRENQIVVTEE